MPAGGSAARPGQPADGSRAIEHPSQPALRGGRQPPQPARHGLSQAVAGVTGKQFVAAVARETDGHVPAGQFADEEGGDLRRVGERFVVQLRQPWNDPQRLVGMDVQLGMLGTQVFRHLLGKHGFVESRYVESDGEGLDRPIADRLHQRHHGGRIDAAGEKGTQRHVRHHPLADGVPQSSFELLDGLLLAAAERFRQTAAKHVPG